MISGASLVALLGLLVIAIIISSFRLVWTILNDLVDARRILLCLFDKVVVELSLLLDCTHFWSPVSVKLISPSFFIRSSTSQMYRWCAHVEWAVRRRCMEWAQSVWCLTRGRATSRWCPTRNRGLRLV